MLIKLLEDISCKYADLFPWWQKIETLKSYIAIKNIIHQLSIDCIIDVGANRGQFADIMRRIGFRGMIISFEPVKNDFEILSDSFRKDINWRGVQLALGDFDGTVCMHVNPLYSVMSSILPFLDDSPTVIESVGIKRLDHIIPDLLPDWNTHNILLKIDTQGYDLNVFRGSLGCMNNIMALRSEITMKPSYESMPHYLDSLKLYEEYDYELVDLSVVSRHHFLRHGPIQYMDCLMQKVLIQQ